MLNIIMNEYSLMTGKNNIIKAIYNYYFNNEFAVLCLIRRICLSKNRFIKNSIIQRVEREYSIKVGTDIIIGKKLKIHHINGIVIGDKVIIGDNCELFQQVTLGQKNGQYPEIGNNVIMYPGCKIIGGIKIGDNTIIAPNSVVIRDVPENAVVSGIPAKIIKMRRDIE